MYTKRNAFESAGQHWLVLLGACVMLGLAGRSTAEIDPTLAIGALALLLLVAAVTTGLAAAAVDRQTLQRTMIWETAVCVVGIVVLAGFVAGAGGLVSPAMFVLLLWVPYLGMSVSLSYSMATGLLLAAGLPVAGWVSDTLAGRWPEVVAYALGVLVGIAVTYLFADDLYTNRFLAEEQEQYLNQQVELLSTALARAAAGDLSIRAQDVAADHDPVDGEAEGSQQIAHVRVLASAFDHTLGNLRVLVDAVRVGGEQLGGSAQELVVSAQQQAVSASEQSSAVSQTTATIEELAATAAQIAETAESVSRFASETLGFAEQGRTAVYASVSAMDSIASRVDQIAVRALSLGEKGQQIGAILAVIDELADQTNLLALNAAIEAARAGEHGRGFAVVAAEVRKLAERSSESAGQIQALVAQIQAETNATILASEEGAREVATGSALARDVVSSLERISGMVDETTTAAKEISIATQQQRSASDQVVAAMTQVSDVSRQYAVGSKQAAASAAQLNGLAAQLRDSIAAFRVEDTTTSVARMG